LYELWSEEVSKAVAYRVIPESVRSAAGELELNQTIARLSHPTTEDFGTDALGQRDQLLRDTLKAAAEKLAKLEGPDSSQWSWGKIHVMKFRHSLDRADGAGPLFDPGPVARPGDEETVDATGYDAGSFHQTSGASYREILDTSDWDKSMAVNVPGQSGQPGSKHYSDLLPLWTEGQYFPLAYSNAAVKKAATDVLVLKP
jgi:penicillin amidase